MKKVIVLVCLLLLLSGCVFKKKDPQVKPDIIEEPVEKNEDEQQETQETYDILDMIDIEMVDENEESDIEDNGIYSESEPGENETSSFEVE